MLNHKVPRNKQLIQVKRGQGLLEMLLKLI
jgi:hypothetical protein